MTHFQELELAICFGSAIGLYVGRIITLIRFAIDDHREKKRRRREETKGNVSEALLLRQQLAKSSVKKYQAMENAACRDNRCREMFQFYGANRTGRFEGRLVQLQNLP